jgi:hypothetical protein
MKGKKAWEVLMSSAGLVSVFGSFCCFFFVLIVSFFGRKYKKSQIN